MHPRERTPSKELNTAYMAEARCLSPKQNLKALSSSLWNMLNLADSRGCTQVKRREKKEGERQRKGASQRKKGEEREGGEAE